jgi:hypothetical protein
MNTPIIVKHTSTGQYGTVTGTAFVSDHLPDSLVVEWHDGSGTAWYRPADVGYAVVIVDSELCEDCGLLRAEDELLGGLCPQCDEDRPLCRVPCCSVVARVGQMTCAEHAADDVHYSTPFSPEALVTSMQGLLLLIGEVLAPDSLTCGEVDDVAWLMSVFLGKRHADDYLGRHCTSDEETPKDSERHNHIRTELLNAAGR